MSSAFNHPNEQVFYEVLVQPTVVVLSAKYPLPIMWAHWLCHVNSNSVYFDYSSALHRETLMLGALVGGVVGYRVGSRIYEHLTRPVLPGPLECPEGFVEIIPYLPWLEPPEILPEDTDCTYEEHFWLFCDSFSRYIDILRTVTLEAYSVCFCPEYFGLHSFYFFVTEYEAIADIIIKVAVDPALGLFG
jgi:hypothetical protein